MLGCACLQGSFHRTRFGKPGTDLYDLQTLGGGSIMFLVTFLLVLFANFGALLILMRGGNVAHAAIFVFVILWLEVLSVFVLWLMGAL